MLKHTVAALLACVWPSGAYDHVTSPYTDITKQGVAAFILERNGEGTTGTAVVADSRQRRGLGKLIGTFVAECQNNSQSWLSGQQPFTISSATTTQYRPLKDNSGDDSFEVDHTDYIGNGCDPDPTVDTLLAKYWIRGKVKFHGAAPNPGNNPAMEGAISAEYVPSVANFTFPTQETAALKELLIEMNAFCPCGGTWKLGTPRSVTAGSCKLDPKQNPPAPAICYIADGTVGWANYKWETTKPSVPSSYVISPLNYDPNEGKLAVPSSEPRYNLPSGGNVNKANCNPMVWYTCGNAIQESAEFCRGCNGLECEGCLFRFQEMDINDPQRWTDCCPCDYYYQDQHQWDPTISWMGRLSC